MNFLMFIPGLFTLLETIVGPLLAGHSGSIAAKIMGLGSGINVSSVMDIITGTIGKIEDAQRLELQAEIQTLLGQCEIDKIEAQSEGFFKSGWRPSLAWGLTVIVVGHLFIAEVFNIIHALGYNPGTLAPMDTVTLALITGLLGMYMGARTVEKVNSNDTDN